MKHIFQFNKTWQIIWLGYVFLEIVLLYVFIFILDINITFPSSNNGSPTFSSNCNPFAALLISPYGTMADHIIVGAAFV